MNSLELLKKLKSIFPEQYYTERSRSTILATERPRRVSVLRMVFESLEVGSAMVLVGVFFILILGGFSGFKSMNISNLNPTSLKAEADAIDIQIELANLNYQDFSRAVATRKESTPAMAISAPAISATVGDNTQATSSKIGIDDALRALSE